MVKKAIRYFLDTEGLPVFWNKIMSTVNKELKSLKQYIDKLNKTILPSSEDYFSDYSFKNALNNYLYTENLDSVTERIGTFSIRYKYTVLTVENSLISIHDKIWVQVVKGLVSINKDNKFDFFVDGVTKYNIIQRVHTKDGWGEWEYISFNEESSDPSEPEINQTVLAEVIDNTLKFSQNASIEDNSLKLNGNNINVNNNKLYIE